MKKRVIISGYPKSGNTWLTRLTAEVIQCPVAGFWCEPFNGEISIEGRHRESDYTCFKSHHTYQQMMHTFRDYANGTERLIYIVRDPRAVVVSASHQFNLASQKPSLLKRALDRTPLKRRKSFSKKKSRQHNLNRLTNQLLNGGGKANIWLRTSWRDHVQSWLASPALMIRYEDLRSDPLQQAERITEFVGIKRTMDDLQQAIESQSFETRKKMFLESGKKTKAAFLRKGSTDAWKTILSQDNTNSINNELKDLLIQLGYEADSTQ
jgi:hypothetical protein